MCMITLSLKLQNAALLKGVTLTVALKCILQLVLFFPASIVCTEDVDSRRFPWICFLIPFVPLLAGLVNAMSEVLSLSSIMREYLPKIAAISNSAMLSICLGRPFVPTYMILFLVVLYYSATLCYICLCYVKESEVESRYR